MSVFFSFFLQNEIRKFVSRYLAVNDRMVLINIGLKVISLAICQTYAPKQDYSEKVTEEYHEDYKEC